VEHAEPRAVLGVETEAATHRGRGPTGGWPRAKSQSVRSSTGEAASATPRAPNHKHNLIQILSYTSTYRRKKKLPAAAKKTKP